MIRCLKLSLQILLGLLIILMLAVNLIKLNIVNIISFVIFSLIVGMTIFMLNKNKIKIDEKFVYISGAVLVFLGLCIRLFSMYNFNYTLVSDFELYYNTAVDVLNNVSVREAWYLSFNGYVCVFSSILALFFKIFGSSVLVAYWFNLICQLGTMWFLYKLICVYSDRKYALLFCGLWFVLPPVIGANLLISTETFFMLLMVIVLNIYVKWRKIEPLKMSSIFKYALFGLLISFANNIRPVMLIFIIALIIDFILNSKRAKELLLLSILIISYSVGNFGFNYYVEKTLEEPIRSGAMEWSLYFGANYNYRGYWSEEDSSRISEMLQEEDGSKLLLKETIARYKNMGITKSIKLFGYKYYHLWTDLNSNCQFVESIVKEDISKYRTVLDACNYSIVLGLLIVFIINLKREIKEKDYALWFFELFIVGYVLANLFVVVNGRYNYPIFIFLVIICARQVTSRKKSLSMISYKVREGEYSSMKEKITKLWNVYKKYGFLGFCKKCYAYVVANYLDKISFKVMLNKKKYEKEIEEILRLSSYDRIILWRSSFGYNVPLFQRPQHIANNLAKNKCLVFYEVTTMTDKVKIMKKLSSNICLFNFNNVALNKILMRVLEKTDKPKYIQLYTTDWKLSIKDIEDYISKGYKFIYEYVDDISPELAGTKFLPKNISDKYEYVMTHEDVYVIVTATALEEKTIARRGSKNLALSSNGVDYAFFETFDEDFTFDENFKAVLLAGKPIMCYYGALAKWFDYDLIKKINDTDKYSIVLFGIKYDEAFDESGIEELKNVYFMGPRDYKVLKNYANRCDILTIPFKINSITEATSPVKIFEYMALHKPIVITDLKECRQYESVLIGRDHEEFIENLEKAMTLKNDEKYIKLLDKEARENDWSTKAQAIIKLIEKDENDERSK